MVYNSGQIKMKKLFLVLSAIVLIAFGSCKKMAGDLISKDFSIENTYTDLSVQDAFDVTVCDTVSQVTVKIGENLMPKVVVEVVDNTLKIYLKPFHNITMGDAKVVIPYNANLKEVALSGASSLHTDFPLVANKVSVSLSGASDFYGNIEANDADIDLSGASSFHGNVWGDVVDVQLTGASNYFGDFMATKIDMDLEGSSDIEGKVYAPDLSLDMSGASDATLEGDVTRLDIELSGSSNIVKKVVENQYALVCYECKGKMSGSSKAYITCWDSIEVNLSGASDLHYTGDANITGSTTSGGSNIFHDVLP